MNQSSVQRLLKWLLPLGVAVTPLFLMPGLLDPALSIRFLYLNIFLTVITALLWIADKKRLLQSLAAVVRLNNFLLVAGLVWLIATIFSITVALQKAEALLEVVRVTFFVLSYVLVSVWFRFSPLFVISVSIGFCLLASLIAASGFHDLTESWKTFLAGDSYYSMTGRMGNRNLLAIMLTLCLPFHFIVFHHFESKPLRIGVALNFIFSISIILLTSSRVGWLGLVVLAIVCLVAFTVAFFKGFLTKRAFQTFWIAAAGVLAILVVPLLLLLKNPVSAENIRQRIRSFYSFGSEENVHSESIRERIAVWKNSVELIKEHPLTGVGGGNWKVRSPEKGLTGRSAQGQVIFQQPHNDFLWVLSETGIPGGLGFIALFPISFVLFFQQLRRATTLKSFTILFAFFAGVSLYAIHSFFDFPKERPLILFTFAVILALMNALPAVKTKDPASQIQTTLLAVIAGILFISWLYWGVRMQGEHAFKQAIMAQAKGNLRKANRSYDKINTFFIQSDYSGIPIEWNKGEIALGLGDTAACVTFFERALELNPGYLFCLHNLGALKSRSGDSQAAIYYWKRAIDIAPEFMDAGINLSAAYYNQGAYALAATTLGPAKLNYTNELHSNLAKNIFGKFVYLVADTVQHPVLRQSLIEISANELQLKYMHGLMRTKEFTPEKAAFFRAIQTAANTRKVSAEEAVSLRKKYLH